jgi:hypothetical protein
MRVSRTSPSSLRPCRLVDVRALIEKHFDRPHGVEGRRGECGGDQSKRKAPADICGAISFRLIATRPSDNMPM